MTRSRSTAIAAALALAAAALCAAPGARAGERDILFFAPGAPGDEAQARETLDAFAAALTARTADAKPGSGAAAWTAAYRNDPAEGEAFLRDRKPALVFLSLPAFLRFGEKAGLRPALEAVPEGGGREEFSIVASPALAVRGTLAGAPAVGAACWDPAFVNRIVLRGAPAPKTCDPREPALRALRRAIQGESVAVVLDAAQAAALPKLPGAAPLRTVAKSGPVPSGLVAVPDPAAPAVAAALKALRKMEREKDGREILRSLRLDGFRDLDSAGLDALRKAYAPPPAPPR